MNRYMFPNFLFLDVGQILIIHYKQEIKQIFLGRAVFTDSNRLGTAP
jgi:hypothetical protein